MKSFLQKPQNLIILTLFIIVVTYYGILIYKEVKPKSLKEQKMQCLELGSNERARECYRLLEQ